MYNKTYYLIFLVFLFSSNIFVIYNYLWDQEKFQIIFWNLSFIKNQNWENIYKVWRKIFKYYLF